MSIRGIIGAGFAALITILAAAACRQSYVRTAVIDVPQMANSTAIRIVTNAALDEVVGRCDGTQHDHEIDVARKVVLYHESRKLMSPEYQRQIEARIRQVGFDARVVTARPNPPAPVPTADGPIQLWPNRFTAVISVPGMTSVTDANVVVDAIAYARLGKDDPRVAVQPGSRQLVARYESLQMAPRNIEYAIACAGFDANDVPAGARKSLPHGWTPVRLM